MIHAVDDTIAAIASPAGGAARGIVRLSGPDVVHCIERVFRALDAVELKNFRCPVCVSGIAVAEVGVGSPSAAGGTASAALSVELPADLYLWPTDRSYTRQPAAELHTLGSPPLLDALLQTICRRGARLAQPGEFTMRAFLAGRLDLAQAEAVLGVISARGEVQLAAALRQLAGGLTRPLVAVREELIGLLAELEAGLDFVEEDIEFISAAELDGRLAACEDMVRDAVAQLAERGDRAAEFRVALVGPPNAGKSSLFNALVHRCGSDQSALVSERPGTTRDYLVARLDLGGRQGELVDTAGLDAEGRLLSEVDFASQAAARGQHTSADLLLECVDALAAGSDVSRKPCVDDVMPAPPSRWPVITKADLVDVHVLEALQRRIRPRATTSAVRGDGIGELVQQIAEAAAEAGERPTSSVAGTAVRCRETLEAAQHSLAAARGLAVQGQAEELVAVELRDALQRIGLVVGAVYTDDILDKIFSRFCIGK